MTQLYQHKWVSTEGDHLNEKDEYSDNFKRWCGELSHFTDKHWQRSYKRIEGDIKEAARMGDDIWPPSSVAVVAYADPPMCSKMYKPFDRSTALEDITAKEKRLELGMSECDKLLKLFDKGRATNTTTTIN